MYLNVTNLFQDTQILIICVATYACIAGRVNCRIFKVSADGGGKGRSRMGGEGWDGKGRRGRMVGEGWERKDRKGNKDGEG